ncbi:MAG: hypothetical protein GY749_40865 [Desulfobacteraceae bacterium]|nr:hypothetical protein [Desulfobacteraceae bacterium]
MSQKLKDHINSFELPREIQQDGVSSDDETSTKVVKNTIVSFVSDIQGQDREDVLNSTLFAELNSDHLCAKKKMTEWYTN